MRYILLAQNTRYDELNIKDAIQLMSGIESLLIPSRR